MTYLSDLIARLEAAVSRDGKPRGDHMVEAFAMMSKASAASYDEFERQMAVRETLFQTTPSSA